MDSSAGVPHPAPPQRCALRLPGDADAAEGRIGPAACKESPLFLQCTVTVVEYSFLLTRVVCLKAEISSDCHKEQQFSALLLFGDAVCAAFHILFPLIGCGVGTREQGASITCAGNLPRCRCLAVAGRGGGEATETCCEHPTSDNRRKKRKVLPGRGDRQGSDAASREAAMLTEHDTRWINPAFPPGLAECSNKQHRLLLE